MSWFLFILPCFHRSELLYFPIFQGCRSVCSVCLVLCVCPHIHLLFSVEAQMYILLILFPAVKLQWGIKDPPHSPLRACRKYTHTCTCTLTSIHTQWLVKDPAGSCTGKFLPDQSRLFSPLTSCSSVPPHLSLPPLCTPHICGYVIYLLRQLYWIEKQLKIGK